MELQGPIMTQPGAGAVPLGCPPGLEYLTQVDHLIVKGKVELLEAFTGFESANKYKIYNSLGQEVYYAKEDTDCCTRQVCGPGRPFLMNITDTRGQEVIRLDRPLRCGNGCLPLPCCLQEIEVQSPPGTLIGTVQQEWSFCNPKFVIKNEAGEAIFRTVMEVCGGACTGWCCSDAELPLITMDGQEVGKITKQWSGLGKEMFTDADNFGINFPMDLDVKMKATLLGALFLVDFMYFEKQNQNSGGGGGFAFDAS